jgi:membrane associated rhomboid family serine protease
MLPVVSHEVRTRQWPLVTVCLVGLNLLVFLFELSVGPRFVPFLQDWGLVPARVNAEVTLHNVATVVSSLFLHVSVIHLLANMWFLFVFGDAVEAALGRWWYLGLYLLSGFFGGMAILATSGGSPLPVVGASGAVSGVMAASLVLWPRARLRVPGALLLLFLLALLYALLRRAGVSGAALVVPLAFSLLLILAALTYAAGGLLVGLVHGVQLPAVVVLGLYFGLQVFNGLLALVNPDYGGSVGWWAHIGGFLAGGVLAFVVPREPRALADRPVVP